MIGVQGLIKENPETQKTQTFQQIISTHNTESTSLAPIMGTLGWHL